jgi:cephalosporin hydroxylase
MPDGGLGLDERRGSRGGRQMNLGRVQQELKRVRLLAYRTVFDRVVYRPQTKQDVVDEFHKLYYDAAIYGGTWQDTYWLGVHTAKCPLDLWVYQEILFKLRPDYVVECGTFNGGSALFLASMFDLLDRGRVITIDIEDNPERPQHDRITYLSGSTTSPEVVSEVRSLLAADGARSGKTVMVLLDSDHSKEHVAAELREYSPFVTKDSYLIVEDTNVNGHPVFSEHGPGPMEAVEEFLSQSGDFEVDTEREKFFLTFNPKGYLRRIK